MLLLLAIISFLYHLVSGKLVIERDQVKEYGMDTYKSEGELVETYIQDHPTCEGVEEEVTVYRYYVVDEDGTESEDEATIATVLDFTYDVDKLCNNQEQWICMDIKIRLTISCDLSFYQFQLSFFKIVFILGHI